MISSEITLAPKRCAACHIWTYNEALELVASSAAETGNFNILDYQTMEEYEEALALQHRGSQFYLISNVYGLGNKIYYVRFSTDSPYLMSGKYNDSTRTLSIYTYTGESE